MDQLMGRIVVPAGNCMVDALENYQHLYCVIEVWSLAWVIPSRYDSSHHQVYWSLKLYHPLLVTREERIPIMFDSRHPMYDGHINGLIAVSWSNPKKKKRCFWVSAPRPWSFGRTIPGAIRKSPCFMVNYWAMATSFLRNTKHPLC